MRPAEFIADPKRLEEFRNIGLRLDRSGTFWHQGAVVSHVRLRQALLRWLDVRDDGRNIVRLDDVRYAYVDVEDAHLRARSARWQSSRCCIRWDDDRETELEYATLSQGADHALYAAIGPLRGRIAGAAYHTLAEHIVAMGDGFALEAAGERWAIATATG